MMMKYLDEAVTTCESLLPQLLERSKARSDVRSDVYLGTHDEVMPWIEACQTVGNILSSMGFVEESHTWQSMAFDTAPDTAKFYVESGHVYSQCEMWERAIYFCQRTLDYQPDNAQMYRQLSALYHQVGDYKAESQMMHRFLIKQPNQATAKGHYQLGQLMERQGAEDKAAQCYEQAITRDKQFVKAYHALAKLWRKQGKQGKVIPLLEQIALLTPDSADVQQQLGRAYRQSGQMELAIDCFRRAIQLDINMHWAHMGLLNSLMQLERWDETVEVCRGVVHFVGEFPWAYRFMANALAKKGDLPGAAEAHCQAFRLREWPQCIARQYVFRQSWFSEIIPIWERYLSFLNNERDTRVPLSALSLGSNDGSAVCWLVDRVLQRSEDRLLCLTAKPRDLFSQNVEKLAEPEKFSCRQGELGEQLMQLSAGEKETGFDLIYVQSDRKAAADMQKLLSLSWPLLKPSGIMIIKDYLWKHPEDAVRASKVGIDAFKDLMSDQVEQLHQSHQVIWQKVG